ncbi:MAG: flagellar basal body L-ring protein FlgH [Planctomycetota bacterium]|jgi:flagellar L-ring protein precursor FlgH
MTAERWHDARVRTALLSAAVGGMLLAAAAQMVCADSIWDRKDRSAAFLYTDNLAAEVGDSLTVLIADESSFSKKGERELEKTTAASGSVNINTSVVDFAIPVGDLESESSRTFEGSNEYTSSRQFADSVTVTVIDKLPNANLVIAGRSERRIAGEDVVTILTGIVKPEDLSASNTVASNRVAHLKLFYETKDPAANAYLQQGFLGRVLNFLWPF